MSLLEAYGALSESSERMVRVRRELLRVPMTRQAPAWFLRPAVALSLLLGLVTVAGATVGRAPLARMIARVTGQAAVTAPAPTVTAPVKRAHHAAAAPAPVVTAPAPAAPVVVAPAPAAAPRTSRRTVEAAPVTTQEETDLVFDARKVLNGGDPGRAAALAETYLHQYPQGGLVEDALQIAIQSLSKSDPARAALFAGTYLRKFPNGPFAVDARKVRNAAR